MYICTTSINLYHILLTLVDILFGLQSMRQNSQMSCPICMKSYENMTPVWQHLDAEIAVTPMPQDYANWRVDILCNDCNQPSKVQFHVLGLKCLHCRSYNTRRIRLDQNQAALHTQLENAAAAQTDVREAPAPEANSGSAADASLSDAAQ